jgi:TPR repeat protein
MRRRLFAVFLVVACGTGAAADSIEEANAAYGRGDEERAAQLFRSHAEQGNARAPNNRGGLYTHGRGVPQDFVRAHMWFNVAAAALTGDERQAASKNRDNP